MLTMPVRAIPARPQATSVASEKIRGRERHRTRQPLPIAIGPETDAYPKTETDKRRGDFMAGRYARATLEAGFTTVRDVSSPTDLRSG